MAVLATIVLAVVGKLMADEVRAWMPTITYWLLHIAVRGLPEAERERHSEEWAADLESFPDGIVKCLRALDLSRASVLIRWSNGVQTIRIWLASKLVTWYLALWLVVARNLVKRSAAKHTAFLNERGLLDEAELSPEDARLFRTQVLASEMQDFVRLLGSLSRLLASAAGRSRE